MPIHASMPLDFPGWARTLLDDLTTHVGLQKSISVASTEGVNGVRQKVERATDAEGLESARSGLFLSVLCDLVLQGWDIAIEAERVRLAPPAHAHDPAEEKRRVREGHAIERDRQLAEPSVRAFVGQMEEARLHGGKWVSIFSLMRDGRELASVLAHARNEADLRGAIDPYIQLVEGDEKCEFTGLRLGDVWRYFRLTWASAYQSPPGRRMHVLVRDRAAENHPIIGIAALGSAVVQLSVRDEWIGWTAEATLKRLEHQGTSMDAAFFLRVLQEAIDSIWVEDFVAEGLLRRAELTDSTPATIRRLEGEARRARRAHEESEASRSDQSWSVDPASEDWAAVAAMPLYRSKRATSLADLLRTKLALRAADYTDPTLEHLGRALASAQGRRALARIVRAAKSQHVGIDMLDITTCGAVAPYNALLGGKLVSVLMMSPEIVAHYNRRYANAVSVIASGMAGRLVQRPPQLVLLGTTSLYGVASSQYNRLRVKANELPGARADMGFLRLGRTVGFGSFHFSRLTLDLAEKVTRLHNERRRIKYIFGEGVNPKLRQLREALTLIGLPADRVMRHGSPRLVYAVPLATNFREVLLGHAERAEYTLLVDSAEQGTGAIADYWRRRWLKTRIERQGVLQEVQRHTLERPVRHGARVVPSDTLGLLPLFA